MKDFNSGDIHGDVTINDNSNNNEYKLLIHCSKEELLNEEKHRINLLQNERSRKNQITWKFLSFSGVLFLIAAGWFYIEGSMNAVSFFTGVAAVLTSIATLKKAEIPTQFELRQLDALKEIQMLLREREHR